MSKPTDDESDKKSEAAEGATSTTSGISKNPIDQNKASVSVEIVDAPPSGDKEDEDASGADSVAHVPSNPMNSSSVHPGAVKAKKDADKPSSPSPTATDQQAPWEMVDDGNPRAIMRGPGGPPKPPASGDNIVKLSLDHLLPHPFNEKLFGATSPKEITDLADSIKEVGQQAPLVVTADLEKIGYYTLLSGHKRAAAMKTLEWKEGNCQLADVKDADDRLVRLLEANRQHVPTTEQKIRIGGIYFGLETRRAKARQAAGAKAAKKNGEVVETLPQPGAQPAKVDREAIGKARDIAAKKVGMSGVSFDRGRRALGAADKAERDGKKETAADLRRILNKDGVEPAFSKAKLLHLIEEKPRNGASSGNVKGSDGTATEVPAAQNCRAVPNASKSNNPAPVTVSSGNAADTRPIPEQNKTNAQSPAPVSARADAVEADDLPPVVSIIAACDKLANDLEELDPTELTNDQKWNLTRAFDAISEWFGNHDGVLKVPGQI